MKVLLAILLAYAWQQSDAATTLRCRRCREAATLDECSTSIPCPSGEICYMDEIITEQRTIAYNGGCRPRDVCSRRPPIGKRAGPLTACSKCCDTNKNPECNIKLCGIKSSGSNNSQCYHCESKSGSGGSGVADPTSCTKLVSCQSDEICGAETYALSTHVTYEFKCIQQDWCTLLTSESLKQLDECKKNPADACPITKRETSGVKVCTACCGDSQCNSESCEGMLERLYNLWSAGVLNLDTLKSNASTAITSTSTTPATTTITVPPAASGTSTGP